MEIFCFLRYPCCYGYLNFECCRWWRGSRKLCQREIVSWNRVVKSLCEIFSNKFASPYSITQWSKNQNPANHKRWLTIKWTNHNAGLNRAAGAKRGKIRMTNNIANHIQFFLSRLVSEMTFSQAVGPYITSVGAVVNKLYFESDFYAQILINCFSVALVVGCLLPVAWYGFLSHFSFSSKWWAEITCGENKYLKCRQENVQHVK